MSQVLDGQSTTALQQIETICNNIMQHLVSDGELHLTLKRRRRKREVSGQYNSPSEVQICFPGKHEDDAWRFTVVLRLLQLITETLKSGKTITKRDIYYRDPALFRRQAVVDRYIEDIALTMALPRHALNVTAAAKGLIIGPIVLHYKTGITQDLVLYQNAILVPDVQQIERLDLTHTSWILVVEKEATFQTIRPLLTKQNMLDHGLVVTGKGYPDLATRQFLKFLSNNAQQGQKMYALVDFDPDGIAIYSNYKHGSAQQPEAFEDNTLPSMTMLGLDTKHIDIDNMTSSLTLTARDRKRASNMLAHEEYNTKLELQRMLMLNVKLELQHLDDIENGLLDLLKTMI